MYATKANSITMGTISLSVSYAGDILSSGEMDVKLETTRLLSIRLGVDNSGMGVLAVEIGPWGAY